MHVAYCKMQIFFQNSIGRTEIGFVHCFRSNLKSYFGMLLRDQEIVSNIDKERKNFPWSKTWKIQKLQRVVHCYYLLTVKMSSFWMCRKTLKWGNKKDNLFNYCKKKKKGGGRAWRKISLIKIMQVWKFHCIFYLCQS